MKSGRTRSFVFANFIPTVNVFKLSSRSPPKSLQEPANGNQNPCMVISHFERTRREAAVQKTSARHRKNHSLSEHFIRFLMSPREFPCGPTYTSPLAENFTEGRSDCFAPFRASNHFLLDRPTFAAAWPFTYGTMHIAKPSKQGWLGSMGR